MAWYKNASMKSKYVNDRTLQIRNPTPLTEMRRRLINSMTHNRIVSYVLHFSFLFMLFLLRIFFCPFLMAKPSLNLMWLCFVGWYNYSIRLLIQICWWKTYSLWDICWSPKTNLIRYFCRRPGHPSLVSDGNRANCLLRSRWKKRCS